MKFAYISPFGGEYVAIVDRRDPLLDHRCVLGELKMVQLDEAHPAHDLKNIQGVAHTEAGVVRFGV